MRANAALTVEAGPGHRCRLTRVVDSAPIGFRQGREGVYMVGTAAGPLGSDQLSTTIEVGAGAELTMMSTAASIIYAGSGSGSRTETVVTVAADATLIWRLEPTIVTSGSRHHAWTQVWLSPSAQLDWTELVVCGRDGERPGSLHLRFDVDAGETPLLRHGLVIGPDGPGWDGPFVLGGRRMLGMRLVRAAEGASVEAGDDSWGEGFASMRLDERTALIMAVGDEAEVVSGLLARPRFGFPLPTTGASAVRPS
ncbi:MAG: urease accessory protein [Acidimicrobiaceae bacterium]|nr:urease accessory protein [Acidimicrobiaceae bacterium]